MIDAAGWASWARRIGGPLDKVYSQPNAGLGLAAHSVVGEESDFQDGIPSRFLSTERDANGRYTDYAAASVTFVLRKSGILIQMYPITASTWTSGSRAANTQYIAMELEGGGYLPDGTPNFGEPMTAAQAGTFALLIRELAAHKGIPFVPNVNILQHKQLVAMYGGAPTSCASDRYQRGYNILLEGEEPMTPEERARLERLERIVAANGWNGLTGEAALAQLDTLGASAFLSVENLNRALSEHVDNHPGGFTEEEIETIAVNAIADKLLS